MKGVRQIREKLGLTQPDMAKYLGVGITTLALAEKGERNLSTAAALKLARLIEAIEAVKEVDSSNELPGNDLSNMKGFELREKEIIYQAAVLKKKLAELDLLYEQNHRLYNVLNELGKEGEDDPAWLGRMKLKAWDNLSYCSAPIREKMRVKINLLVFEAQQIRQLLEGREGAGFSCRVAEVPQS